MTETETETELIGVAAPLFLDNLDTDQIMPKQFLRGIDKGGLDNGLFYDLRFDGGGARRVDFVLNRSEYARCRILVAGENFGCGSSREHAVWGLLQYGIRAVVAPSFGEIFYSNAMNNQLLLATVKQADVEQFMRDVSDPAHNVLTIDVAKLMIRSRSHIARFSLSLRYQRMFLDGVDLVGASLLDQKAIAAFEKAHWQRQPWVKDVGAIVRTRLRKPHA
jgi:3-isopropylmalate/(R)-2-methylmalate dehydratase small subunit